MKSAEHSSKEWSEKISELLGEGLRYDPILTGGKSVIEHAVDQIQSDSRRQGMLDAAKIVRQRAEDYYKSLLSRPGNATILAKCDGVPREYDGAFKCYKCGATWGAVPSPDPMTHGESAAEGCK